MVYAAKNAACSKIAPVYVGVTVVGIVQYECGVIQHPSPYFAHRSTSQHQLAADFHVSASQGILHVVEVGKIGAAIGSSGIALLPAESSSPGHVCTDFGAGVRKFN